MGLTSRIEREDVIDFINACFAGSGQQTFYEPWEVVLTLDFLHEYMAINYRDVYASTLALGVNTYNQGKIIANLLRLGQPDCAQQARREWSLMLRSLEQMPAPQAYGALLEVKRQRINNRRARALIRTFLQTRPDWPLHVVKYRRSIKALIAHAHIRVDEQARRFLYSDMKKTAAFEHPLYEAYRQAQYSKEALYALPFSVAQGFASLHGIRRQVLLERMSALKQLTKKERMRTQNEAARRGVEVAFDWSKATALQVTSYMLSLPLGERKAQLAQMEEAISKVIARLVRQQALSFGRVAVVADCSYSCWGASQAARRPLSVAVALNRVFEMASQTHRVFWTQPNVTTDWLIVPGGPTNLARPLLRALAWQPELVVIISDGVENDPPGAVNEIARVYQTRLAKAHPVSFVHLNPVLGADNGELQGLGDAITTMGIRQVEDLGVVMQFARFAQGQLSSDLLQRVLSNEVDDVLSDGVMEMLDWRRQQAPF